MRSHTQSEEDLPPCLEAGLGWWGVGGGGRGSGRRGVLLCKDLIVADDTANKMRYLVLERHQVNTAMYDVFRALISSLC